MLACKHVPQSAIEPDFPAVLFGILLSFPISHVDGGRKRRGKPVHLSIHFPGKHLRLLHLIWTQRWQDVVCHHQELWWRPQMGLLSRSRCEGASDFPHFTEESGNLIAYTRSINTCKQCSNFVCVLKATVCSWWQPMSSVMPLVWSTLRTPERWWPPFTPSPKTSDFLTMTSKASRSSTVGRRLTPT